MKIFFAVLAICLAGALADTTDEEMAQFVAIKNFCIKEIGINAAKVESPQFGPFDEKDRKLACFIGCVSKKRGLMNADGTINEDKLNVRGSVAKERAIVVVNKCKAQKGADDCETAMKVVNCMFTEDGW